MIRILPTIDIDESLPVKDQLKVMQDSLNEMIESLSFMLSSIDTDNLSPNLLKSVGGGDNSSSPSPTINMGISLKKADADMIYVPLASYNSTMSSVQTALTDLVNADVDILNRISSLDARVLALEQNT